MRWRFGLILVVLFWSGCAEGPLWRLGKFNRQVRQKWADEERLATTLFTKKQRMADLVNTARASGPEARDRAAQQLVDGYLNDSVLLTRLHAIRHLGELDSHVSRQALTTTATDPNVDIRLATVEAWRKMPADSAVPALAEMLGSDTHGDVRIAATRALGDFKGSPARDALRIAINDSDPAIQLRAMESLGRVTGESLGRDIAAWRAYLGPAGNASRTASGEQPTSTPPFLNR